MPTFLPEDSLRTPRFVGITTFMRLPHTRELEGGDAAVLGIPFDTGSPFRVGCRFGPSAVRAMSLMLATGQSLPGPERLRGVRSARSSTTATRTASRVPAGVIGFRTSARRQPSERYQAALKVWLQAARTLRRSDG